VGLESCAAVRGSNGPRLTRLAASVLPSTLRCCVPDLFQGPANSKQE